MTATDSIAVSCDRGKNTVRGTVEMDSEHGRLKALLCTHIHVGRCTSREIVIIFQSREILAGDHISQHLPVGEQVRRWQAERERKNNMSLVSR